MTSHGSLSFELQVLSRRMKSEVKPSIPAETDPVGRLKHVGNEATQKLKNPRAAGWNFENCPIDIRPIEKGKHISSHLEVPWSQPMMFQSVRLKRTECIF